MALSSKALHRTVTALSVMGTLGAFLSGFGYFFVFEIEGIMGHGDPGSYYWELLVLGGFVLAGILAAIGIGMAQTMTKLGGMIQLAAACIGIVSLIPYLLVRSNGLYLLFITVLGFPPWWTMLLLASGLFQIFVSNRAVS